MTTSPRNASQDQKKNLIGCFFTKQFIGFVVVGGLAAFLHWISRIIFSLWLPFHTAIVLAYGVGMAVAFILNRKYIFPNSEKPIKHQIRDFTVINIAFLPVVWAAAVALEPLVHSVGFTAYPKAISHGIAVVLPTLITFIAYKFIAFKDKDNEQ